METLATLSSETLKALEKVPDLYLILSPDLVVLTASDAYLAATFLVREEIIGRRLFDVFNPSATSASENAVKNLYASLQQVIVSKKPHQMEEQRYDVLDLKETEDFYIRKCWLPLNVPVLNEQGEVWYIIHKVEDVTEQRKTAEKLQKAHQLLKDAQAIGHIGSFERELSEDKITWSDELYRIHGLEPQSEEITVDRLFSFIHPDDRQEIGMAIKYSHTTGEPLNLFHRIIRADGEIKYVQRKAEVLKNSQGNPVKVYGSVQDITEQTRTSQILDNINEVCFELDENFIIRYANRRSYLFWSRTPEQMLGKSIWSTFPEVWGTPVAEALQKAYREKRQVTQEVWYSAAGKWILLNINPSSSGLIVLHFDITEQVKAWQQLQEQQRQFETLVNNIPDTVSRWSKNLKLKYANPAFEVGEGALNVSLYGSSSEAGASDEMALEWMKKLQLVFETGEAVTHYSSYSMPHGVAYFHSRIVPEKNSAGDVETVLAITRDITELKQAQNKLEERETLLKAAEEVALVGSYEVEIATMAFRCSDGMFLLFGEEPQSFTLTLDFIDSRSHPTDADTVKKVLDQAARDKQPYSYTRRIYRHDGQWRTLESHGKVVCDEAGNALKFIGLVQDITERKKAEQELQESKELLHSVFEVSLTGINVYRAVRDEEGNIVDFEWILANEKAKEYSGGKALVGRRYAEMFPGIKQTGVFEKCVKVVEGSSFEKFETYYTHDEFDHWFSFVVVKLGDGMVMNLENITEQKKSEQELLKQHQVLKQAEEVAQIASWEYDLEAGILHWSENMYRLFDLPMGSPVTLETYLAYVVAEDRFIARNMISQLRERHEPVEGTVQVKVNDQILALKIKSSVLLNEQGQPIKILGVSMDISEVKRLEQENLKIRLNQQKAQLIAVLEAQEEERRRISESLHNGVGQILYATKLNLERVTQLSETKEALQTVGELLSEAIKETRRVSHELVPVLLNDFGLKEALQDLCRKYENCSLFLRCQIEGLHEGLEPYLEVALYRISQELINNIVRHSEATAASLMFNIQEEQINLEVRDNGKGFIYQEGKTKGIGLQSIENRVKLLNGTLSITTPKTGKGTLVTITVPVIG